MKKALSITFALLIAVIFTVSALNATPKIANKRKAGKKVHDVVRGGKKVKSCSYCHQAPIKKLKGVKQYYYKGQKNYAKLGNMKKCAGSGCH